jgi:ATP-dependent phosphofructokinase / diphosphate-dependent phosphofructokinase
MSLLRQVWPTPGHGIQQERRSPQIALPPVRVGILTGGGDCPGLNAVIRAIVRKGEDRYGDELIGFLDAWDGVRERRTMPLNVQSLRGMLPRGGTLLGTRRGSPFDTPGGPEEVVATFADMGLDGLIVIGGNGSLSVACDLHAKCGLPIVGVPKTIDNDIVGTEMTFGFTTAVQIATDAIDRLHTTAESHDRVMVVEVMGRHSGWIATYAGIAGGATEILIPEEPFDIDEVCRVLQRRHDRGRYASIVVVAEGAEPKPGTMPTREKLYDQFGHVRLGGIADTIAHEIEARSGLETRVVLLGHIQRGGTPCAFDRVLSTRYGIAAIDAVHAEQWGTMAVLHGDAVSMAPLSVAVGKTRRVDLDLYHIAEVFFG